MNEWANRLIEQAGPVGAALGVVIIAAVSAMAWAKGMFGKLTSASKPEPQPAANTDGNGEVMAALHAIEHQLDTFDRRIGKIENDLASRPTSEQMHKLELALTRMDGRIDGLDRTANATNASVNRMEEFLYNIAGGR